MQKRWIALSLIGPRFFTAHQASIWLRCEMFCITFPFHMLVTMFVRIHVFYRVFLHGFCFRDKNIIYYSCRFQILFLLAFNCCLNLSVHTMDRPSIEIRLCNKVQQDYKQVPNTRTQWVSCLYTRALYFLWQRCGNRTPGQWNNVRSQDLHWGKAVWRKCARPFVPHLWSTHWHPMGCLIIK